ncbi:sensor histidine kinase [Methanosarcina sp. MSH10X1]|uniref:ATP-binding protein n=1 Tax=Methanosarcina sp. MSH10X1 TaxID=2507075 RepID=UPI000FFB9B03|nr:ATP-binding protein [Methanosarcina sp. MSH10X1]RXA15126.1 sensor histidine kinase [Methanosarcina sp. MSH10X1]
MRKNNVGSPGFFSDAPQRHQISAVYKDAEELTELLVTYFKEGIEGGEYCLWISPDKLTADEAKCELKKEGLDVEHYLESSQLEILPVNPFPENLTSLAPVVRELAEKGYRKTLSGGFSGFRTNFDFKNAGDFLNSCLETCEETIETVVFENNKRFTLLCTLPLEELSGKALLGLMEENDVFAKRKGEWKLLRNLEGKIELENIFLKAEKDIEAANRTKNGLIINMSHELRTPLNSVIGFSDLLLEGAFGSLNTRQSKYVNNILISGKNLLEIVNNLLDISRLEAGERNLNYEDVDIASLIGEVRMSLLSLASNKKITVEVKVDASLENVRADRTKLRQTLYNLMNNAIKFTPQKGRVTVNASKKAGMLEIKVSDSGIGLSKKDHERIFMPFIQADSSTARGYGGAGLGLYIAKNFIDLHGGKIWVESEVEKGSIFIITLPMDHKGEI